MLPGVIDLFSGCGGMALGFEKAGFKIIGGIEIDPDAHDSISANLCWRYGEDTKYILGDIKKIPGDIFKDKIGKEGCIVIGGPPCQAYSMAGRGKLRSLGEHRMNTKDERGYLYKEFLRFVFAMDAKAVIMENVPQAANYGGKNILEIVCNELVSRGYSAYWTILNAADFGVPQIRERAFVVAVKGDYQLKLPVPTHCSIDEKKTHNEKQFERLKEFPHFVEPLKSNSGNRPWVTVGDCFSDLPVLFHDISCEYENVTLSTRKYYSSDVKNNFQLQMRKWFGKELKTVSANVFRNTERDFPIFNYMNEGDNYLDASKIAEQILRSEITVRNCYHDGEQRKELHEKIVPKANRSKFERKWLRLNSSKPSHTVVAHLSKDTYSHIHPWEPRGISVREAARLQSFPDDFFFGCNMGNAYKQIGNAVPPLLSYGVARALYDMLKEQ